ncbi:unknown [Clostridium sp. CAG:58]|nr:unknown [Clostridium sp. CAG:58]
MNNMLDRCDVCGAYLEEDGRLCRRCRDKAIQRMRKQRTEYESEFEKSVDLEEVYELI